MIEVTALASGSTGNCYHVTDGKTRLLLECGIPFKRIQQKLNFELSGVAGCLVSHEHKDHCKAVRDVLRAGIDVYLSLGTYKAINLDDMLINHRIFTMESKQQLSIGTWTILPFETQHDAADPLGFLLVNQEGEKLIFATDTYYVRYRFKGLNYIMVECNYAADILQANVDAGRVSVSLKNRLLTSHFSLENVKEFLKANDLSRVQEIWLIHLSEGNSDAERFKREIQELTGKMVIIP